jgi:hypothetical protein
LDVENIALGRDFRVQIQEMLSICDALLVVIDRNWLAPDASGTTRLSRANDFVRLEIETALKQDLLIVPVLVGGATFPDPAALPEDIRELSYRNGFELTHTKWKSDLDDMVKRLGFDRSPFEVPKAVTKSCALPNGVELLRLQNRGKGEGREDLIRGGGCYYSFVRRTHEYGYGSDIELQSGQLMVGFAGLDYGYLMPIGEAGLDELLCSRSAPPATLNADQAEAWAYMWDYAPPSDMKLIRADQRASDKKQIGQTTISRQMEVHLGKLYLLRSIEPDRSDVLVALIPLVRLSDSSLVLAYRVLKTFPITKVTGREN